MDGACFQAKVTAHIDREVAARPELVTIETAWRSPKEQRPGALNKNQYRELAEPDNPDAEPPYPSAKSAIVVFGKHLGRTVTVCLDDECPVHTNHVPSVSVAPPPPSMPAASEEETEEETAQREADHEQRMAEYQAEQDRQAAERKAEFKRQQKKYEEETRRREKAHKARLATLERIVAHAPASFDAAQLRLFVELLLHLSPYGLFEEVAEHLVQDPDHNDKTENEILSDALVACADDKLMGFVLRLLLTTHTDFPLGEQPDLLAKAEAVFAPPKPKVVKAKQKENKKPVAVSTPAKKKASRKKAA
ncbi:hypothetical protein [Granulicella sp. dw_53]|uniref:hypothetical protein n=1 Tax=Granulicella sp. dw_53 TaxID=2719792 RepID=UPI0021084324|nr:hypothetical protein [Granulicella sp. dw_53]